MLNLKILGATGVASFLLGTFGGGWIVNKVWYGKSQAEKLKQSEAVLSAVQDELDKSRALAVAESKRAESEALARQDAENRLSRAYQDNAALAQSRASTTTRIIEKGQDIGQSLKTEYPCIYSPWPLQLRDYAFRLDASEGLSGPASGGYPTSD